MALHSINIISDVPQGKVPSHSLMSFRAWTTLDNLRRTSIAITKCYYYELCYNVVDPYLLHLLECLCFKTYFLI